MVGGTGHYLNSRSDLAGSLIELLRLSTLGNSKLVINGDGGPKQRNTSRCQFDGILYVCLGQQTGGYLAPATRGRAWDLD